MAPEPKSGSHALLLQMVEQNDDKHEASHHRIRRDLTEGLNDVNADIETLAKLQRSDHEVLIRQGANGERRKELSMNKAVVIAALIGGGFQFAEVVVKAIAEFVSR